MYVGFGELYNVLLAAKILVKSSEGDTLRQVSSVLMLRQEKVKEVLIMLSRRKLVALKMKKSPIRHGRDCLCIRSIDPQAREWAKTWLEQTETFFCLPEYPKRNIPTP